MKQIFHHYTLWEDYQNGMYEEQKEGRAERVQQAVFLLTHADLLYTMMANVTRLWKHATEQNLTNPNVNHQAFLGQAACNLYAGIKEDETREAWGLLTETQRHEANKVADRVFSEWIDRNTDVLQISLFDEVLYERD